MGIGRICTLRLWAHDFDTVDITHVFGEYDPKRLERITYVICSGEYYGDFVKVGTGVIECDLMVDSGAEYPDDAYLANFRAADLVEDRAATMDERERRRYRMAQISRLVDAAIGEAPYFPEPIKWMGLSCVGVIYYETDGGLIGYRAFIEEAPPNCTKFIQYIKGYLGNEFSDVEVVTGWGQ